MIFVLELIGTVAFAISGALVGIRKKMDIFGIAILAMTTAVGGGIIRDVILNITPPMAFREPVFALSAVVTGLGVFCLVKFRFQLGKRALYEALLLAMDAIGLGLFTVIGVETAFTSAAGSNAFLAVFVGVITGVGGGVLRDVLAGETPYVFTRHFYACASLIGAIFCTLCWPLLGSVASMLLGASSIVVLRGLAAHFRWSLPKVE